ncbi:DMT family transporter [Synechococcus moorigangaii CMS01]|nr:DMT family transporter [Synechococcus moorigangaii CMS01]
MISPSPVPKASDQSGDSRLPEPEVVGQPTHGPLQWNLFLLILALLAVSFAAIFIRWCSTELGAGATVFNRLWLATAVLGAWEVLKPKSAAEIPSPRQISGSDYGLLLLVGAVSSSSVVLWALSLTETSVANSTVLRNLTPLFTTLGAWWWWQQRFDRRFLWGMALAIGGAIAIGITDFQLAWQHLTGDCLALLSALCYGVNLLLVENLRDRLGANQILLWRCGFGCLLLLPFVLLTEDHLFPQSLPVWAAAIGLAVLCQCFGQGLVVYSLKTFSSGFVAIFLLLEPILTAVFAWALLGETLTVTNAIAFGGVLGGIYLAKSSPTQKSRPQTPEKQPYSSPAT